MTQLKHLLLAGSCGLLLSACATQSSPSTSDQGQLTLSVRPDQDMIGIPGADKTPAPSLDSIMGEAPPVGSGVAPGVQVRDLAIQEAALAYGARAGLANASQKIDFILNEQRDSLDKTWNIGPLEIVGPSGTKILPPVITERTGVYDQPDANTVLIADDQYEIVAAARFSPVTPLWQTYLIMSWSTPTKPDYSVYPKTDDERAIWKAGIAKGWAAGQAQAIAIFKVNVSRLQRDYAGMLKWEQLVSEGKASAPVVAETLQGVTGGGDKLTVGQGIVRLTAPAQLLPNPANWHAPGQVIQ